MSIWVKICANTSFEDAQRAVDAGADAVGFVFAPSPRRVTVEQVAGIAPKLTGVEKIGVFDDWTGDEIAKAVEACGLTGVQLHAGSADDDQALTRALRERIGAALRIIRVLHFDGLSEARLQAAGEDPNADAVLVDSRTATAIGGTGIAFDWQAARKTVFGSERGVKLIAAGGLTAANVSDAIATLRPWGVDVASGVELSPGRKDPEKVRDFVARARAAAGRIGS